MNLVFLIDSTLNSPLFLRDNKGKVLSNVLNVNWYAEENRTFTVNNEFFDQINKGRYVTNKQRMNNPDFIEVKMMDFNQFENLFWNKHRKIMKDKIDGSNLNALVVWSEIMSYIKGSSMSYSQSDWHLDKERYLDFVGVHKTNVSKACKAAIWEIAQKYEEWKTEEMYFDLMDVVAYLITKIIQASFFIIVFF